jgi:hypothetical protein
MVYNGYIVSMNNLTARLAPLQFATIRARQGITTIDYTIWGQRELIEKINELENNYNYPLVIETGYQHSKSNNWSYHIFMVIDNTGARLYKSAFGGEDRMKVERTKLSAGQGTGVEYKARDIAKLHDIEKYTGKNWGEGSLE